MSICKHCRQPIDYESFWTERWFHTADDMLTCNTPGVWPKTHATPKEDS